jgi:hypothetical protein
VCQPGRLPSASCHPQIAVRKLLLPPASHRAAGRLDSCSAAGIFAAPFKLFRFSAIGSPPLANHPVTTSLNFIFIELGNINLTSSQ